MTPAVRRAALSDLRDARDAERRGDWKHAYYVRRWWGCGATSTGRRRGPWACP